VRIDVVAVTFNAGSSPPVVEHYQNAFDDPG
jgi:hypothetical protein